MKKILYIFDDINYRSGAQKAMLIQIKALQSCYRIYVLSLSRPKPGVLPEGIPVVGERVWERTKLLVKKLQDAMKEGQATRKEKAERILYSILLRLGKAEGYLEKTMERELKEELESFDVVIVVNESSKLRSLVAKLEKPKKVQWIHTDYKLWSSFSEWTRHITREDGEIYLNFDYIVALSGHSREGLLEKLPRLQDKVEVIPNLIDGENIKAKSEEKLVFEMKREQVNLLTVGRLDKEKGFGHILDLCVELKRERTPFCWYLVGDGPLKGYLRNRIMKEGLESCVVLVGYQDNPYPLMKQCDWFVLMSEYEGTPVTIDEAMVLGTPVAARDVGGIREQLERGEGNTVLETGEEIEKIRQMILKKKKKMEGLDFEKQNHFALQKVKAVIEK